MRTASSFAGRDFGGQASLRGTCSAYSVGGSRSACTSDASISLRTPRNVSRLRLQETNAWRRCLENHPADSSGRDDRHLNVGLVGLHGMHQHPRRGSLSLPDLHNLRPGRDGRDSDPRAYQPGPCQSSDHGVLSGARTQDDPRGFGVLLLADDRRDRWLRIAEGGDASKSPDLGLRDRAAR